MSWRGSGNFRSSGSSPRRTSGGARGGSVFDGGSAGGPPLITLIIACGVIGVIGLSLALAGVRIGGGAAAPVASAPTAIPAPTAAPTAAPAAAAAPTAAPAAASAGPVGDAETTGDAAIGATLFAALPSGVIPCASCHNIAPGSGTLVGPSLSGLKDRAGSTVAGETAAQYVRAAIVAPNNHVPQGFAAGIMPQTYGDQLTPEQVEDLVAYLLSLP